MTDQSESLSELAAALCAFQAEMPPVPRTATNPYYDSRYAPLDALVSAAREHLSNNGLAVVQTTLPSQTEHCVDIVTTLLHSSGQWLRGRLTVPYGLAGKDNEGNKLPRVDPQGMGIAISYGRRYAYAAILGIVTDEDDDANAVVAPPRQAARAQRAPERDAKPAASPKRGFAGIPTDPPLCPVCGGDMWDNRADAEGTKKPRWKCKASKYDAELRKETGCAGVVWRSDPMEDEKYVLAWGGAAAPAQPQPGTDALREAKRALKRSLDAAGVPKGAQAEKVAKYLDVNYGGKAFGELGDEELGAIRAVAENNLIDWETFTEAIPF